MFYQNTYYKNHVNEAALHKELACNVKWHCKAILYNDIHAETLSTVMTILKS
jgi:hypothetical protein